MEKLFLVVTEVFLDTSFAIALSSITDQNHLRAVKLANQIETSRNRLVTTQAILLEIGNALSKQRYRAAATQLLESLETDPSVEVVVMQDRGITDALTADTHFQQAGFRALLKD